jgi:hypothetical protein
MDEWHETATVKSGGKVEVILPELRAGEHVEVVVRRENGHTRSAAPQRPQFGFAKGTIQMSDDFDAPLEDFKDYT